MPRAFRLFVPSENTSTNMGIMKLINERMTREGGEDRDKLLDGKICNRLVGMMYLQTINITR